MSDALDGSMWAAIGAAGTALVGGVVRLVGSRKERDASSQAAAEEWKALHEACKRDTDVLRLRMDAQDKRIVTLERVSLEHAACGPRMAYLEREQAVARGMLHDLMRNASTPPAGLYTGDDVRAELTREETGK